ncbi:molybdenum cofactor sulfurase 2-like isoform X5 [Artemia franciscana]
MREYAEQKNVPIVSLKLKEFTDYFQSMEKRNNEVGKSLVAFPAQCNFTGYRMPLNLIEIIKQKLGVNAYVCLDAASFVSTTVLDLSEYKPDFVCISFYKIFGCPTGLGCLLVKKTAEEALLKTYYGGGTVFVAASTENFHVKRKRIEERFEDGTLPYLEIVSLNACFDWLETNGSQKVFSNQPYELAALAFRYMQSAFHSNSSPMFEVYSLTDYTDSTSQGGIISFNMRDSNGHYVGYAEVDSVVTANKFCVRTGCFCNPGACQTFLKLTKQDLLEHFKAGHVCGDNNDLVEGKPTGAIRLSFGPTNTYEEVEKLLKLLNCTFKGYTLISKNRSLMGRGGLAFIIKDDIKFKVREDLSLWIEGKIETFAIEIVTSNNNPLLISSVYRPPGASPDFFLEEIEILISEINRNFDKIVIIGDFNFDLLDLQAKNLDFLNVMLSFGLFPLNSIPSRLTDHSATLIDNVFVTEVMVEDSMCDVLIHSGSDHLPLLCLLQKLSHCKIKRKNKILRRDMKEVNLAKFKNEVSSLDWEVVYNEKDDASKAFNIFSDILYPVFEKNCPLNKINYKKAKPRKPWINDEILSLIRQRNKLYCQYLDNPSEMILNEFKELSNYVNNSKRNAKNEYYLNCLKIKEGNIKDTWGIVREVIGCEKKICV